MKTRVIILMLSVLVKSSILFSQPIDTNLYETPAAALAAPWLKQYVLPSGTGNISSLLGFGPVFIPTSSRIYVRTNGVAAYYANTTMVTQDMDYMSGIYEQTFPFARKAGINFIRCAAFIPWGFIEPSPGVYHYEFIDSVVYYAGINDINILGTVIPYNDFASYCNTIDTTLCNDIFTYGDFFFLTNRLAGQVCDSDTSNYYNFIYNLVERYDGDGVNDMPGLLRPMTVWEVGNEPDGPCGNYDYKGYAKDLGITYRAVKSACPTCLVANGGSIGGNDSVFWYAVMDTAKQYIDIANMHENKGKNLWNYNFENIFKREYDIFQDKIDQYLLPCPVWCTEWGLYSGDPDSLPYRSEEEQAELYTKFYCWGLANNLPMYFYDFSGPNSGGAGSSALLEQDMSSDSIKARLWFYTSRLYEYKFRTADSAIQFIFSGGETYNLGHIRFWEDGNHCDVVWGLNNLPGDITGVKHIIDIYGNITTANVSSLSYPLSSLPVIIEDTTYTTGNIQYDASADIMIYPNPAYNSITLINKQPVTIKNAQFFIYTMHGQLLIQQLLLKNKTELDISSFAKGVYFVKVENNGSSIVKKLVIE